MPWASLRANEHEKINFFFSFFFPSFASNDFWLWKNPQSKKKIFPKWNCVKRWNFTRYSFYTHMVVNRFLFEFICVFYGEKSNEWIFSIFSRFPKAFQNHFFCVFIQFRLLMCWFLVYDTTLCLRHHQAFLQLKCAEIFYLPCATAKNFQVSEKMLVGDAKRKFSFRRHQREATFRCDQVK